MRFPTKKKNKKKKKARNGGKTKQIDVRSGCKLRLRAGYCQKRESVCVLAAPVIAVCVLVGGGRLFSTVISLHTAWAVSFVRASVTVCYRTGEKNSAVSICESRHRSRTYVAIQKGENTHTHNRQRKTTQGVFLLQIHHWVSVDNIVQQQRC